MRMAGAYIFGMQEDVYEGEYYFNLHLNSISPFSSSSRMNDDMLMTGKLCWARIVVLVYANWPN